MHKSLHRHLVGISLLRKIIIIELMIRSLKNKSSISHQKVIPMILSSLEKELVNLTFSIGPLGKQGISFCMSHLVKVFVTLSSHVF